MLSCFLLLFLYAHSVSPRLSLTFEGIPQLVASVVLVSARFAKLKAELVNILYTLPEKPMRWVDKDEAPAAAEVAPAATTIDAAITMTSSAVVSAVATSETATAAMDTTAPSSSSNAEVVSSSMDIETETVDAPTADIAVATTDTTSDVTAVDTPSPSLEVPSSTGTLDPDSGLQENAEKSIEEAVSADASSSSSVLAVQALVEIPKETKVERKLKRRLKRRQNNERVMGLIQSAATPQQLLEVLIEIEEAIPKTYKYSLNDEALPSTADTCAALAVRVYVLDRRIRYDEIKELEKQGMDRQYKPRYHFAPRCLMSSSCTKFLSHTGKCTNDSPLLSGTGSRIPDINDNLSNYANINAAYLQQRASAAALQSRYRCALLLMFMHSVLVTLCVQ